MVMTEKIFIPYLLRDGAVIQRNKSFCFWGYASAGIPVKLKLNELIFTTKSDVHGYFEFNLLPQEAGGPYTIEVQTSKQQVEIHDILFGDVWLLGGQSNMQLWMGRLRVRYPTAISKASNKNIRFFEVPQRVNFLTREDELESGEWKKAVSPNIEDLSGVGYFFAHQQYAKNHVPIGLISTAIGGTRIRSWVSYQTLDRLHELPENFDRLKSNLFLKTVQQDDDMYQEQFLRTVDETDLGKGLWELAEFDDSKWKEVDLKKQLPDYFRYPGVVWMRKRVHVPPEMVGSVAQLRMGTFIDADEMFIDGKIVGRTEYQYPPREYTIGKLKSTFELVIRLKIFNYPGGVRLGKSHLLVANGEVLDIDEQGLWRISRGGWMPERKEQVFLQYEPVGLFNGMISPLKRMKVAGILWYQGESDTGDARGYGKVFNALISEWRQLFGDATLPFLYVQLPNCGIEPNHAWALIRQEQLKGIRQANTGMVVSLGMGENNDLHPTDKKIIAQKLSFALESLKQYPNGFCTGPLATHVSRKKQNINIHFSTFGSGLHLRGVPTFEVLIQNTWYPLCGGKVRNSQIDIEIPKNLNLCNISTIRYGWGNTPEAIIVNDTFDPAVPFCLKILD